MEAAVFMGNHSFQIQDVPIPEIGPEDVLVKVTACGVCGTDVHIYHGDKASAPVHPPVILGHEFAGVVVKTGLAVKHLKTGDHVTVDPNIYCGQCIYCQMGKKQLCTDLFAIGVNRDGGFAEYCSVPETQCYLLNPEIDLRFGAMTEPLACCIHGMDRVPIRSGDIVCIVGGGAIGLIMLQLAKLKGAAVTIVSEPVEGRREVALKLGATYTIDPIHQNMRDEIRKLTGTEGADAVIECAGNPIAVRQCVEAARSGATVLLFSVPMPDSHYELSLEDIYQKELTITGSKINPDTHGRAAALINQGVIHLDPIITHQFPISRIEDAIKMQMSNESLKVIVAQK